MGRDICYTGFRISVQSFRTCMKSQTWPQASLQPQYYGTETDTSPELTGFTMGQRQTSLKLTGSTMGQRQTHQASSLATKLAADSVSCPVTLEMKWNQGNQAENNRAGHPVSFGFFAHIQACTGRYAQFYIYHTQSHTFKGNSFLLITRFKIIFTLLWETKSKNVS